MDASVVSGQALLLTIFMITLMSIQFPIPTISRPITTTITNNIFPDNEYIEYIKKSCNDTLYPKLCYKSLANHSNEIKTDQKLLVLVALNVTLKSTKLTSRFFRNMSTDPGSRPRGAAAVAAADCVEEVGDAADELKRSIEEMEQIGRWSSSSFYEVISDVQTWVSTALTDDCTCTDGFSDIGEAVDPNLMNNVRRRIERIAHLSSNALSFINRYAST